MKADEIRAVAKQQSGRELKDSLEHDYPNPEFFAALIQLEIAAQLAELNENLKPLRELTFRGANGALIVEVTQ